MACLNIAASLMSLSSSPSTCEAGSRDIEGGSFYNGLPCRGKFQNVLTDAAGIASLTCEYNASGVWDRRGKFPCPVDRPRIRIVADLLHHAGPLVRRHD